MAEHEQTKKAQAQEIDYDQAEYAKADQNMARCLFCGMPEQLIWVHGHGQCAHCGVNAMPCCDGAVCDVE